jgi:hypothetical protein
MEPTATRETNFLNVDLDLTFAIDIEPMVRELGDRVMTLNRAESFASFELAITLPGPNSTDEAINGFAQLVRGLSRQARAVWDGCARRTMNVGVEGPAERPPIMFSVSRESIGALVDLGADLIFTVYGPAA